jgi:hypothetical protein
MNIGGLVAEVQSEQIIDGSKVYMEIQVPEGIEQKRHRFDDVSTKGMSNTVIGLVTTNENG